MDEAEIFLRGNTYLWHEQRTPKVLQRIVELVRRVASHSAPWGECCGMQVAS